MDCMTTAGRSIQSRAPRSCRESQGYVHRVSPSCDGPSAATGVFLRGGWDTSAVDPLPSGTVTFMFTDLEGSTRLWERHPVAMRGALARHDSILQDAVASNHGV